MIACPGTAPSKVGVIPSMTGIVHSMAKVVPAQLPSYDQWPARITQLPSPSLSQPQPQGDAPCYTATCVPAQIHHPDLLVGCHRLPQHAQHTAHSTHSIQQPRPCHPLHFAPQCTATKAGVFGPLMPKAGPRKALNRHRSPKPRPATAPNSPLAHDSSC